VDRATFLSLLLGGALLEAQPRRRICIAHRGASAYAPENTLPAYRLAVEQGAHFVEQDLQITEDGVLVCLHDLTLERTTDVAAIYPGRHRRELGRRRWYVSDFTLEEIKRLDAGSWFSGEFRGVRIPTFQEAIDLLRGKAGLYPETKAPEVYGSRGFDMMRLLLDALRTNGLDEPGADPKTPVIVQSFSAASLIEMTNLRNSRLPRTLLIGVKDARKWRTAPALAAVRGFATGIGPQKIVLRADPGLAARARAAGLTGRPAASRPGLFGCD
jgi:glycerophosphoryl diester phosphodiesterase